MENKNQPEAKKQPLTEEEMREVSGGMSIPQTACGLCGELSGITTEHDGKMLCWLCERKYKCEYCRQVNWKNFSLDNKRCIPCIGKTITGGHDLSIGVGTDVSDRPSLMLPEL